MMPNDAAKGLLCEANIADVDCDHEHFQNRPAVGSARVGTTFSWKSHTVD